METKHIALLALVALAVWLYRPRHFMESNQQPPMGEGYFRTHIWPKNQ